jgi:hypothetical protein
MQCKHFSEDRQRQISPSGVMSLYLTNQTNVNVNPIIKFHAIYSVVSEMKHAKRQV